MAVPEGQGMAWSNSRRAHWYWVTSTEAATAINSSCHGMILPKSNVVVLSADGASKNIAVHMTVSWPMVTWNLVRDGQDHLKNRILVTLAMAPVMMGTLAGVDTIPLSSDDASSCVL